MTGSREYRNVTANSPKKSKWYTDFQYNDQNKVVKSFYHRGLKKKLVTKNIYNANSQLIETEHLADSNYHICVEGIEYAVRKGDIFRNTYVYNENGLIIRQTRYLRTILIGQQVYTYSGVLSDK
ncbi:MAG: hypothetical protein ABIO24_10240 [Saprospiraceae bacterium]